MSWSGKERHTRMCNRWRSGLKPEKTVKVNSWDLIDNQYQVIPVHIIVWRHDPDVADHFIQPRAAVVPRGGLSTQKKKYLLALKYKYRSSDYRYRQKYTIQIFTTWQNKKNCLRQLAQLAHKEKQEAGKWSRKYWNLSSNVGEKITKNINQDNWYSSKV